MRLVLDSSVAFKWVVPEIDSVNAVRLRGAFRKGVHDILSPDVFFVELAHSLTRAERQKRIPSPRPPPSCLTCSARLQLSSHPTLLLLRACAISSRERIGFYDCLYVALAEREGCEFVTADDRLIKNLSQQFPFIIALSSLP